MTFYETVVLKNYKVYKKDEKKNVLQNALPFIDDFLLQTWHYAFALFQRITHCLSRILWI